MTNKANNTDFSEVVEQMAVLRADITSLTAAVSDLAKFKGAELSDAAKQKIAAAKEAANDQTEAAIDQALKLQGQALGTNNSRTKPRKALCLLS